MASSQPIYTTENIINNIMPENSPYIKKVKRAKIEPDNQERQISFAQIRAFFLGYALKHKVILIGLILISILQALVTGFGIWYLKEAIDLYFQSSQIIYLIYAVLLVTVVKSVLEFLYKWGLNYFQMYIRDSLIEKAFSDLLHNDFYLHIKVRNSRKYGWVLEDTEKFIESMFALFQLYLRQPLQIISIFIAVLVIDWKLALIGLLAVPALLPLLVLMRKKSIKYIKQRRALLGLLEEKVAESVYAIRIVKTFGLESRETNKLHDILKKQRNVFQQNAFYNGLMGPLTEVVGVIGLLLIIVLGMQSIEANSFTAGTFLAFMMAFLNVYRPFKEITNGIYRYQLALDTGRRLINLQNNVVRTEETGKVVIDKIKSVKIQNLWFSYALLENDVAQRTNNDLVETNWILNNVNISLIPGETILLAGMSGAGKSTLCDLLMGLYSPHKGKILINGHTLENIAKSSLRNLMVMCSQETIVFDDSLFINIQAVKENASFDEVMFAAQMAEFPEALIENIHEPVGDRGISLSGGERQRLALARAILIRPHLMVIDEAMNNIDPDTENKIWLNLKKYLPETTFIVVSHRWLDLSYYDRLFVMGKGCILKEMQIEQNMTTKQVFEQYRQALGLAN